MPRKSLIALIAALLVAVSPTVRADEFSSGGGGAANEQFNSNDEGGGAATRRGCPDPRNEKYTQSYGVQPLFLPIEVANDFYSRDPHVFYRCGFDMCHENSVVCWPRPGATNDFPDLLKYGGMLQGHVSNVPEEPSDPSQTGGGADGTRDDPPGDDPPGDGLPGGTGTAQPGLPTDPDAGPPPQAVQWINGAVRGFGNCASGVAHALGDTVVAVMLMSRGEHAAAAEVWGLEPGQGTVLRGIIAEANAKAVNAAPDEAGERTARRICQVLLLKAAHKLTKGRMKSNPIPAAEVNANWGSLSGKWVQLGEGPPVKLGKLYGGGQYGAVYANETMKGGVVKVFKPRPQLAAAMQREIEGFKALPPDVPAPKITKVIYPEQGKAGVLLREEVSQAFPGERVKVFGSPRFDAAQAEAVQRLYEKLGDNGVIAADLSHKNVFGLQNAAGQWRMGILDGDMIFPARSFGAQLGALQNRVRLLLSGETALVDGGAIDAGAVMRRIYQTRVKMGEFRPR